ncbi:MAG TPA: metal ABC transporter substrate-binding protein [Mycobacteriales bacterium]|nr:metal ABC transporter substrate-binding protein [Mycobacteriales bacterium]
MRRLWTSLLGVVIAATGCAAGATDDGRVRVVAAFYPLEFVARQVAGDRAEVRGLAPSGAEPHDLELTPKQVGTLREADLLLLLEGFQPAVDDAAAQADVAALDVADVEPLETGFTPIDDGELHEDERGFDPHVWLDPRRLSAIARAVADRLGSIDRTGADTYQRGAQRMVADLTTLDGEFRQGLRQCARREIVTSHNAFGYLARAYRLEQIGITGLTPEDDPSPGRLAAVVDLARRRRVTTIFFEEAVSPKVARSIAREVGAQAVVLSPLETAPADGDYFTAMRRNLRALRTALGCT